MDNNYIVRNAKTEDFKKVGELMVQVYSQLEGFPKQTEQPDYYKMLANIGDITIKPRTDLLIAASSQDRIVGAVVYFNDMSSYGSGGTATQEKNAAGFRLLAVDPETRGNGIGKLLIHECIERARNSGQKQIIIHSTEFMKIAWKMYEKIGFKRSKDLDFMQGDLPVYGFRLNL